MKKYLIFAALVLIVGLLINNLLGGFSPIKPQIVSVKDYTIYGAMFEGNYKSNDLNELVDKMRKQQTNFTQSSELVIINYFNEPKETIGLLHNFVGIKTAHLVSDSLVIGLEKRTIPALQAIRVEVPIKPLVMPSPEKVKKIAFDYAKQQKVELQNFSIEQYTDNGMLVVEFPVKQPMSFIQKMAHAYGFTYFDTSKTWHYTFNVKKGDIEVARAWTWNPASGNVVLIDRGDTVKFNHNVITDTLKQVDHKFINDKYWLLFPFQLVWDTGYTFQITEQVEAPISKSLLTKLTIHYNSEAGYTPGDAYDCYVDSNFEIKEWVFRKGGQEEPSLVTTWSDYQTFNGVKVATNHLTSDSNFRLWFTHVENR